MTDKKKHTAEADIDVKPVGAKDVSVRTAEIRIKDEEGKVVRTIPRPPERRFGDGAKSR